MEGNSTSGLKIKPRYALLCDDVRREDNGKAIFVGVYTIGILVEEFPRQVPFVVYLNGAVDGFGETKIEIRVNFEPGNIRIVQISADVKYEQSLTPQRFEMTFGTGFQVHQQGEITVEFRSGQGEWETVERVPTVKYTPVR